MARDLVILHGPIRSGKTTGLAALYAGRPGAAGILQPDGPTGRVFRNVTTGATAALEPVAAGEAAIEVGRFRFRADAFAWANARLAAAATSGAATIVVDEIGPLEVRGSGLVPGLEAVLAQAAAQVLLVVRDPLVDAVRARFGLRHARIVPASGWPQEAQASSGTP